MGSYQVYATKQAAWSSSGKRPTRPQWHLLGPAIWAVMGLTRRQCQPYGQAIATYKRMNLAGQPAA